MWQRKRTPGHDERSIQERREELDDFHTLYPLPPEVAREQVDARGVPGLWLAPPGSGPLPVLFYLHGGGYTRGSVVAYEELVARIATSFMAQALVIDYRLAPEHPYPAALDDALAAYRFLIEDRTLDPGRLVLAGDSAGGGLGVATMLRLRETGRPLPRCAVLISPWLDLRSQAEGFDDRHDPMLSRRDLVLSSGAYRGGASAEDPLLSPVLADLRGMPPTMVLAGGCEALLPSIRAFRDRAAEAGAPLQYTEVAGLFHDWPLFAHLPESTRAVTAIGSFVTWALGG